MDIPNLGARQANLTLPLFVGMHMVTKLLLIPLTVVGLLPIAVSNLLLQGMSKNISLLALQVAPVAKLALAVANVVILVVCWVV